MAFQNKNLSVIAYANGFTLWHYASRENMADTMVAGYFNDVSGLMNRGDIILLNATDRTSVVTVGQAQGQVVIQNLN